MIICLVRIAVATEMTPSTRAETAADRAPPVVETAKPSRYFAIFGTYESPDGAIELSHTFATFLRTFDDGGRGRVVESCTISWLPASGQISMARAAEPGVNKSLADTIAFAEQNKLRLSFDGPYETDAVLFRRAVEQAGKLNRGEISYKCFDRYSREKAKNCMHAISDLEEADGRLYSYSARGREGTQRTAHHLRSHFLRQDEVPSSLGDVLFDAVNLRRFQASATDEAIAGVGTGRP
jgi:hypothetical protein